MKHNEAWTMICNFFSISDNYPNNDVVHCFRDLPKQLFYASLCEENLQKIN